MILFMIYAISTIVIIRKKYYIPDCLVWPIIPLGYKENVF